MDTKPQEWLIDALSDMHDFALLNDLDQLAEQLDLTLEVALHEIAARAQLYNRAGKPMRRH